MKRIIRLTESDLTRIVRRVIMEQGDSVNQTINLDASTITKLKALNGETKNIDVNKGLLYGPGLNFNLKSIINDMTVADGGDYRIEYFDGNQWENKKESLINAGFGNETLISKYPLVLLYGKISKYAIAPVDRNKKVMYKISTFNPNF